MSICKPSVTTTINIPPPKPSPSPSTPPPLPSPQQKYNNNNNNDSEEEKYNWIVLLAPFKFCTFARSKMCFHSLVLFGCGESQQLMLSHLFLSPKPMDDILFAKQTWNVTFTIQMFRLGLSNQIKSNRTKKNRHISNESVNCIKTEWMQNCDAIRWLSLRYHHQSENLWLFLSICKSHIILYKSLAKRIVRSIVA